jgi:hypothetical protein
MRITILTVHNNQVLEIFKRYREDMRCYEVWMVSSIKGQRIVLDHFITSENYERFLRYAKTGDVQWQDADEGDIPSQKTEIAQQKEETIERGVFWNDASLCCYNASHQLHIDRKAWNAAKESLIGHWTDGTATLIFEPDSKLQLVYPANALHPHFVRVAAHQEQADFWAFSRWWLFLMNKAKMQGQKIGAWRCDEHELHIFSGQKGVLVHVFHRV